MKRKKLKRVPALALAAAMVIAALPITGVYAGQQNSYHDPLEQWVTSGSRTNEMDINAVVTQETMLCSECGTETSFRAYRVPEYTKDGVSAAARGIMYSDGTMADGESRGEIREGRIYTGNHWAKGVCTRCGTINSNSAKYAYCYGKNVYGLHDCAGKFVKDLAPETNYEYEGSEYHRLTEKTGSYCGICYGTTHKSEASLEKHHFDRKVTAEPADKRFRITENCRDCGYSKTQYKAAKTAVADFYGRADGKAYTVSVTPISDKGVEVSAVYGKSADKCTMDEPPSYKKSGDYPVYYVLTYKYGTAAITENGTAYVHLKKSSGGSSGYIDIDIENSGDTGKTICSCGDPDCCCGDGCDGSDCESSCGEHRWKLADKAEATCENDGYDRYVCEGCGRTVEKNRKDRLGHDWEKNVIKEESCETEGKVINICRRCGQAESVVTARTAHRFVKHELESTCTLPGYTATECAVCGLKLINNIKPALAHDYRAHKVEADCLKGGHTMHLCDGCGSSFITDYTEALGHSYDAGKKVTDPDCTGSGVTEYSCERCGHRHFEGSSPIGHRPGDEATCTSPQICRDCGAVIKKASGHDYKAEKVEAGENKMGYTVYTCSRCGDSYKTDYTAPKGNGGSEKGMSGVTDTDGRAYAGDYMIFVNDASTGTPVEGAAVTVREDGSLSIVLPDGRLLGNDDRVTVTVLMKDDGDPVRNLHITVSDRSYNSCSGVTDSRGRITVPAGRNGHVMETHQAYMYGYPDGTFRADGNMTRAEASAVFARLLADSRGEDAERLSGIYVSVFADMPAGHWASGYVNYLLSFGIVSGDMGGFFRPDENVSRAELTAMAVRFDRVCSSGTVRNVKTADSSGFSDVGSSWAGAYISEAHRRGWISGYGDGTFRADNPITRAEMISITNNLLNRAPDMIYIRANSDRLTSFRDLGPSHWAYYPVMESANGHWSSMSDDGEAWNKIHGVI